MSVNRYGVPAKLPNAQPFFELPFNEIAGAMSARQQRYDTMTEGLAKAQAEASAIKAMPGADTEYAAKIQNKLKELEVNYIDQDLAGPAGTDLLREVRKTALDPNITKIGQSYEGWRNYVTNVDKLKTEGKYDPSLDDNRWKSWDTVGSGNVFDGRIESWDPADLKQYYDNVEGTIEVVGDDGKIVKYVSDDDIRRVVDASGKNFYDTPDGRKWVKVDKSRTDQDAVSMYYPDKTYGELTDEEYANDILYRGGEEFKTYQEDLKRVGKESGSGGSQKTDHFHLFSMPGGGQAIEPVIGLGGSAAGTQEVIAANNSMAKHLESHEGVRSALQTAGAFGAPTEANNYQGVNLNPAILDKIEFRVVETPGSGKKVIWETKEVVDPETGQELPGPTVEEAAKIDKAINNNPNIISTLIAGAEAHRRTATAANQFMNDLKDVTKIPKTYKIRPEQMAAYNERYGGGIRDIVLNPDDEFWGSYGRSVDIATEFGQYVESKIPLDSKYSSRDITNYIFYGTGPALGGEQPHTITAEEATQMHIPELAKEFIRDYYKKSLDSDATLTSYQRENRMNTLEQKIVKAQFDAYSDVGDPNFARLSEAYKQATQESAIFDLPHYTFGTTPAAKEASNQLEKGVNDALRSKNVGLYNARTNELVPYDEGWWFRPDKSETGSFVVQGWRPDASKNTSGTVLLLNYKDKEGNGDGRLYEVRDFGGISKYLVDEDPSTVGAVTLIEESHKLNQALADNNYYRASYSMGEGYPTVSVRRLPTDIVSSTGQVLQPKGTLEFIDPFTKTPVYASNEKDMFDKYYQMSDNNMGRLKQELPLLNKYAEEANVKPNYEGAGKGRVIPPTEIADYINATPDNDNVPNSLLYRVINVESAGDATAVNPSSGAAGIAQIMPTTAANPGFGIKPVNPFDPKDSIRFAKDYLDGLSSRYQKSGVKNSGDLQTLMLVGYYGGTEAADFLLNNNMNIQKLKEKFPNSHAYLGKFTGSLNLPANLRG